MINFVFFHVQFISFLLINYSEFFPKIKYFKINWSKIQLKINLFKIYPNIREFHKMCWSCPSVWCPPCKAWKCQFLPKIHNICKPKVREHHMAMPVQQQVFGLQVPVDDVLPVQIAQRTGNFGSVETGTGLGKTALLLQMEEELEMFFFLYYSTDFRIFSFPKA